MIETLDIDQLEREICGKCLTSRTCNIRKNRHDKKYRVPFMECSVVKNNPTVILYNVKKFADDLAQEIAQDHALEDAEKAEDESDAHQAYCDHMKQLGDPAYTEDPRPDLKDVCAQLTDYPCAGCKRESECNETYHPDSAEIDHNDPINQR